MQFWCVLPRAVKNLRFFKKIRFLGFLGLNAYAQSNVVH